MEVQRNSCMYVERNNNLPGGLLRFSDGGVGNKGSATTTMMPFASKLDGNTLTHADHNGSGGCLSNASGSCVTSAGLLDSSSNLLLPPSSSSSSMSPHFLMLPLPPSHDGRNCYNMDDSNGSLKAKIMVHPHYPRLLTAYANCHKVGAPREVVSHLEDAAAQATTRVGGNKSCIGDDPALDQFMEAYCEMLTKYEQELTKPFKEAMIFINKMESQFKSLSLSSSQSAHEGVGRDASSEDEEADDDNDQIDPQAKERELKDQLLKRYSGYLGSLKQEFLKKRKKGKLPKEARQQLLDWWARHYKWPYPSESQKLALAESTGLDQKQINNWFINQRKRHWRPSEEMQLVVMDASHPHYYMDDMGAHTNFPMDCSPMLL